MDTRRVVSRTFSVFWIIFLLGAGYGLLGPVARLFLAYRETSCNLMRGIDDVSQQTFVYTENKKERRIPYEVHALRFTFAYSVDGRQYTCKHQNVFEPDQPCTLALAAEQEGPAPPPRQQAASTRIPDLLGSVLTSPASLDGAAAQAILARFEAGKSYPCWYDPEAPQFGVLLRRVEWFHVLTAAFLLLGLACFTSDLYRPRGAAGGASSKGPERWDGTLGRGFGCVLLLEVFIGVFVYWVWFLWKIGDTPVILSLIVAPFALLGLALLAGIPYAVYMVLRPRWRPPALE